MKISPAGCIATVDLFIASSKFPLCSSPHCSLTLHTEKSPYSQHNKKLILLYIPIYAIRTAKTHSKFFLQTTEEAKGNSSAAHPFPVNKVKQNET